jgi:uncharacterized Zn finger protein (UPF0148 family)
MFCTQCGKPVPEGAHFCPSCGSALKETNMPTSQPMTNVKQQNSTNTSFQNEHQAPVLTKKANLQRGVEFVGGHVNLYPDRIFFKSHSFNIQNGETSIKLADIVEMGTELIPTMFWIRTRQGNKYTFVVWGRKAFMNMIRLLQAKL